MIGRVVSNKAMKTATVLVQTHKRHPLYGKSYVYSKKYLVDDPFKVAIGDIVEFVKVAPISKRKHWRITKVTGKDIVAVETEVMKETAQEAIEEVMPVEEVSSQKSVAGSQIENQQANEKVEGSKESKGSEVKQKATEEKPKRIRKKKEEKV